jgi:hypothetical protein
MTRSFPGTGHAHDSPHTRRRVAAVVGIVSALAVVLAIPRAFARDQERPVVPPEVNVFGRTYGEWSATWWQWLLSIPAPTNPMLDPTGQHCDVGQSDLLFFLLTTSHSWSDLSATERHTWLLARMNGGD